MIQVGYEDARYSVNEGDGEVELCVTTQRPVMRPFVIISTTMDQSAGIQICCQNEHYALCLSLYLAVCMQVKMLLEQLIILLLCMMIVYCATE